MRASDRRIARVEIFDDLTLAEPHWRALEQVDSLATPYQYYDFLKHWQRHVGVLYLAVPVAAGLGAPTIIVDTALKIFLGTLNLCSTACDLLVPRQTAAFAARNARLLWRTTLTAVGLCAVPVLIKSALLLFDAKGLFALLLGRSATMPEAAVPILLVLLATAAIKSAPNFLLQHTGYFRVIARLSVFNAALMTAAVATGLLLHADVVGFLAFYAGTFVVVATLYVTLAARPAAGYGEDISVQALV